MWFLNAVAGLALMADGGAAWRPPALLAKPDATQPSKPVDLAKVQIADEIVGRVVKRSLTMTFRNTLDRPLEGTLYVPMPDGATPTGYALDLGGELVDAVALEKQEARQVFEYEQRKGVDPGLLEWQSGNHFQTRVWPIPAKGTRTVRVDFLAPMEFVAGEWRTSVPKTGWGKDVEVSRTVVSPGRLVKANKDADRDGVWTTAFADDGAPLVTTGSHRGESYFVADLRAPAPAAFNGPVRQGGTVLVAWDASLSRANSDLAKEFALLASVLNVLAPEAVETVAFRNAAEAGPTLRGTPKEMAAAFAAWAGKLAYDGGTNLGALQRGRFAGKDPRLALLFTDGQGNLGPETPDLGGVPVFAISSAALANRPFLADLAERSGGVAIDLTTAAPDAAAARIAAPAFRFLGAEYDPKAIADFVPERKTPVQGNFTIAGRLLAEQATVKLRFGDGQGADQFVTVAVRRGEPQAGNAAALRWALKTVEGLVGNPDRHRDQLLRLGKQFGLATPATSLLVLETLEQHLEHGIEPAKSRAKLHQEWSGKIEGRKIAEQKSRGERLDALVKRWDERVKWWRTERQVAENFRYREPNNKKAAFSLATAPGAPAARAPAPVTAGGLGGGAAPADRMAKEEAHEEDQLRSEFRGSVGRGMGRGANPAKASGSDVVALAKIDLQPWDPQTPYLKALKAAGPKDAYAVYLDQRFKHGKSPGFFLDCAEYFFNAGDATLGQRVLTNILDLELAEPRLVRIVARRLQQAGQFDLAIPLFEQVRKARPEEPQSHRDLALALAERADAARKDGRGSDPAVVADATRVVELLAEVAAGKWDDRFPDVDLIAVQEANAILAAWPPAAGAANPLDQRLRQNLECDLWVALTWDTDLTDIDLWVNEPTGERCLYSHPDTAIGGRLTRDCTRGYGPEAYALRKAFPGVYGIEANFYGANEAKLTGGTTIAATVVTNFGRPNAERKLLTVRLVDKKEGVKIGAVTLGTAK